MSNDNQRDYWNGKAGATWVAWQERLDGLLAPLSDAALARAAVQGGERVIDIGCGCGTTSRQLAERGARVRGIDISAPMLAHARARFQGTPNLIFSQADASTEAFTPDHQLLFSRFGVMFFEDPVAAFRNLRTALTPDGRLVFLCWQEIVKNPWIAIAGRALQPFLPPPPDPPPAPGGPDPFAFADTGYVAQILEQSRFRDVTFEALTPQLHLADDLDDAMAFQSNIGPLSRALAELQGEVQAEALSAARAALAPHVTAEGLRLGAAAWLVTARAG